MRGATDRNDQKAWYSNFGDGVDVVAPGGVGSPFCDAGDVLSTYALDQASACSSAGYELLAGTSMAAPHVSGIGALLAELGTRGADAAGVIMRTADDLGPPGVDSVYGSGRVNACKAVSAPTTSC